MPEIPESILEGCRPLEEVAGIQLRAEARWHPDVGTWCLDLEITIDVPDESAVPATTRWFVALSPDYPLGSVDLLPAREGGLTETFHHQLNNSTVGVKDRPWRPGKICVDTGTAALDRHGKDSSEPRGAAQRLRWHLERARLWLTSAARGELVLPGDPFELPDYRPGGRTTILFHEDESSLSTWKGAHSEWGRLSLAQFNQRTLVATAFCTPTGEIAYAPPWGPGFGAAKATSTGLWVLTPQPVVTPPWQAPMTWGALLQNLNHQGIDLMALLARVVDSLRDGQSHYLLLGYPIPLEVGGEPERIHWAGLALPVLTREGARIQGFRNSGPGLWSYDRSRSFRTDSPLSWVSTENGSDSELTARGALHSSWREARVLCIGAGALGSAIAELLIRGGARNVVLCDGDDLEPGNLVRHTLTGTNLGENKATALASRLIDASPHAHVHGIAAAFPSMDTTDRKLVASSTVIIDCSANDDVLHHLARFAFDLPPTVFHVSFGAHAQRLFVYGRSDACAEPAHYLDWIDPWLHLERRELGRRGAIRPSAGCWHPAFPARPDHIWLLAATAMSWMNEKMSVGDFNLGEVFKRDDLQLSRETLLGG